MKKILLATTVLVGTAGFAAAEVTLSGSARMGIVNDGTDTQFSSRIRVNFGMAGETDGGLSFGASIRADQAGTGNSGGTAMDAGSVFVSGAFGKISMGDNDTAANATIGQVDGVGYTGNGDLNEIAYLGQTDTSVLYTYSAGDLSVAASVGQLDGETGIDGEDSQAYSVAAAYTFGDYKLMAGYEKSGAVSIASTGDDTATPADVSILLDEHFVLGGDATFGAVTVKARYGMASGQTVLPLLDAGDNVDMTQYALSATYKMDALSLTAFAAKFDAEDASNNSINSERYGLGVSYDLGGGAAASAGYSTIDASNSVDGGTSTDRYDAGLTFSF